MGTQSRCRYSAFTALVFHAPLSGSCPHRGVSPCLGRYHRNESRLLVCSLFDFFKIK